VIPPEVERRARWVLDSIGATEVGFGDDVSYDAEAWEQAGRGELPDDDLAAGFFHLARVEERNGPRDEHGRFRAEWSRLDPLDPPLERLREKLRLRDPSFTVARTHAGHKPSRSTIARARSASGRSTPSGCWRPSRSSTSTASSTLFEPSARSSSFRRTTTCSTRSHDMRTISTS